MSRPQDNVDRHPHRPEHKLAAVLPGQVAVDAVIGELSRLGMDVAQVYVLHGAQGVEIFDQKGEHHGWRTHVSRAFKSLGVDGNMLENYNEALEDGKSLVLVPLPGNQPRQELIDILRDHGGGDINYFTYGSMETIY